MGSTCSGANVSTVNEMGMGAAQIADGKLLKEPSQSGMALLIIDPQNDFHPPTGSLAVNGAIEDSDRIIKLLKKFGPQIDTVVVTLDSHHKMHIAHPKFWVSKTGENPAPFTLIKAADIKSGEWKARQPELQDWALEYATKLEAGGRFVICVWPEHCLIGTPGHAVYQPLSDACNEWAAKRSRSITFVMKGQNNRTEMYSALKAEVVLPDDPSTGMNYQLIKTLKSHSKVICCGEAKSHCVNYTVRDLLSEWPKGREKDIVVLTDCQSCVPGFEAAGDTFFKDMAAAGCTMTTASSFSPPVTFQN